MNAGHVSKKIAEWVGGVKPHMRLSNEQLAEIKREVDKKKRRTIRTMALIWVTTAAILPPIVRGVWQSRQPALQPPVFVDDPARMSWVYFGIGAVGLGAYIVAMIEPWLHQPRLGEWRGLFPRYCATVHNCLIHRLQILLTVTVLPSAIFMFILGWNMGLRIDNSTIANNVGFLERASKQMSDVVAVAMVPSGAPSAPSDDVLITFRDGSTMYIDSGTANLSGRQVAEFVAARTGVQVHPGRP